MHLSKPHHDAETLVLNVVNPTAGLLEGDEIDCRVDVQSGARLLLLSEKDILNRYRVKP